MAGVAPRVVVDHVAGSRRGQRQEFAAATKRVQFGRHPDCEVSFDPHRDIDASTRHAELRSVEGGWVLVDLGSSNGTYVEGRRVTEIPITRNQAVHIEFGSGGPRVRLFIGDDGEVAALPTPQLESRRPPTYLLVAGAGAVILLFAVVVAVC